MPSHFGVRSVHFVNVTQVMKHLYLKITLAFALLALAATLGLQAQTNFSADIGRAVSLGWLTVDGKLYQVQISQNLSNWSVLGPVIVGKGLSNTAYYPAANPATFFRIEQLPGTASNRIVGLQQFLTGSANIQPVGNSLDFSNLRVEATGITVNDLVNARFVFDPTNQLFRLSSYAVSAGVGVYREPYFAKDNTNVFTMTSGASLLQPNIQYTVTGVPAGGMQIYADLTVGHAPVLWFDNITVPVYLRAHGPSGVTNEIILPDTTTFIYSTPWPALTAGRYYFDIVPVYGNTANVLLRQACAAPKITGVHDDSAGFWGAGHRRGQWSGALIALTGTARISAPEGVGAGRRVSTGAAFAFVCR